VPGLTSGSYAYLIPERDHVRCPPTLSRC